MQEPHLLLSIIILRCLASSSLALISALSLVRLGSLDLDPATSDFGCRSLTSGLTRRDKLLFDDEPTVKNNIYHLVFLVFSIALVNSVLTVLGSFSNRYDDLFNRSGFFKASSIIAKEAASNIS